jgi:ATP-dependent helicase/nuclease subunit A
MTVHFCAVCSVQGHAIPQTQGVFTIVFTPITPYFRGLMILSSPTLLQQRASNPESHIWVGANAGSGKTKVLVDRVLRLLLQGTPPDHILCITFTKAAAAEMVSRLQTRTRAWVWMEEDALMQSLQEMSGTLPSATEIHHARRLFAVMTDCPVGVRIQTIHAFCQQLLSQFPEEAGIAPHFTLLEDSEQGIMVAQAKRLVLAEAYHASESPLAEAIAHFTETSSEFSFSDLIESICHKRGACAVAAKNIPAFYAAAGFAEETTPASLSQRYFDFDDAYRANLRRCVGLVAERGLATDKKHTHLLEAFVNAPYTHEGAHALAISLLNQDSSFAEGFPTKAFLKAHPDAYAELRTLAQRASAYMQEIQHLAYCTDSVAMLRVADAFFRHYGALKETKAVLDYEDLIERSLALLEHPTLSLWVLYKLDGRIEHLLMDEAQDVSPNQWRIAACLTDAFFDAAGEGERRTPRSLFVVGDEKQSIFGFQGAIPERFGQERWHYAQKAEMYATPFAHIPMQTSFRSGEAVMTLVDTVFAGEEARMALSSEGLAVAHIPHRKETYGQAVLYPLLAADKNKEEEEGEESPALTEQMAELIASTIAGWLREGWVLASTVTEKQPIPRAICPSDILILLRARKPLMQPILQALHRHAIASAGVDRLMLSSHLAVRDMMALAAFLCDESDDMALACVLTSPLYGMTYDTLTRLTAPREEATLWECLQAEGDFALMCEELRALQLLARTATPHALFAEVLYARSGFTRYAVQMGEGVRDVLQSFLFACVRYGEADTISLHGFITWMQGMTTELKREGDGHAEGVRIMTVHGAKGLEAPVVILPDTLRDVSMTKESLLVVPESSPPLVVYLRGEKRKHKVQRIFKAAYDAKQQALTQESYRLFYVALTRACDELHVFGYKNQKAKLEGSWYGQVKNAMETLRAETQEDGTIRYACYPEKREYAVALAEETLVNYDNYLHLLEPVHELITEESFLSPSTLQEEVGHKDGDALERTAAQQRGTLIHALFERQTNQPWAAFMATLPALLRVLAPQMSEVEHHAIIAEMAAVNDYPEIIALLERPALAEVPLIGRMTSGGCISGRMDRLIVTDDTVHVIDFKTGSAAGDAGAGQMRAYGEVLRVLYPHHTLRLSLLHIVVSQKNASFFMSRNDYNC